MCRERVGDHLRQRQRPLRPWRLGITANLGPGSDLLHDPDRSAQEVDVLDPQRQQLSDPQPEPGLGDDHGPVALGHGVRKGLHLLDGERNHTFPLVPGELHSHDGRGGHEPVEDGR